MMRVWMPEFLPDGDEAVTVEPEATAAAGSERPAWLPENFKTPEDLAKSYDEARREMDRLRSEGQQRDREFAEALQQIEQQNQQRQTIDPASDPRLRAYQDAVDSGDAVTQLAITLDLNRQMMEQAFQAQQGQMGPQMQQLAQAQRSQQIDMAEQQAMAYARERGLDYENSRQDVIDALRQLYGDGLLPEQGDVTTYAAAIRNAVDVVTAQALVEDIKSGEAARREKLSAMTTTPGASGRLATGHPDEQAAWAEVKNAPAGSFSELVARNSQG